MEQGQGNECNGLESRDGKRENGSEQIAWKISAAPLLITLIVVVVALEAVTQFDVPLGKALFCVAAGIGLASLWIV